MIGNRKQRIKYIVWDYIFSNLSWFLFSAIRYFLSEQIATEHGFSSFFSFMTSHYVLLGQALFPIVMMFIFHLSGYYNQVFQKSRLHEIVTTFITTFINSIVIYFIALIDDNIQDKLFNYELILILWGIQFTLIYIARYAITSHALKLIYKGKLQFNILIIGNSNKAHNMVKKLQSAYKHNGYNIVGYLSISDEKISRAKTYKPTYQLDEIQQVCTEHNVTELHFFPSENKKTHLLKILNTLFPLNLPIKSSPDMYNILVSKGRIATLYGEPLIDISGSNLSASSANIKRLSDIIVSLFALILLSPLLLIISVMIKRDSKGSVFYKQKRVGLRMKPFSIYKFRSMRMDAEGDGTPMLSSENDERITKIGRWLRKYRLDEIPQFFNVLRGDMSLVGARPEREYYINQIMPQAPYYTLLFQVRPGITSMGMVKFGYASNVEQMIERSKYDILYLENMSLLNDLKILIYTIKTVITGKGI